MPSKYLLRQPLPGVFWMRSMGGEAKAMVVFHTHRVSIQRGQPHRILPAAPGWLASTKEPA